MPQLSTEERLFIAEKYIETKNFVIAHKHLRLKFNHKSPCKKSIQKILESIAPSVQV